MLTGSNGREAVDVGEMERRKALVFVMAIVLIVLAAMTFALTTTMSGSQPEPMNPESISSLQVSSASWAGGTSASF
jgi:flagellar basal body-associated protein FliL